MRLKNHVRSGGVNFEPTGFAARPRTSRVLRFPVQPRAPRVAPAAALHFVEAGPRRVRDRHAVIAAAAYLLAQQRGWTPGRELDDWLEAERLIDDRVYCGELPPFETPGRD